MKGSSKGSEFERSICRLLSLWWTDGRDGDVFWRNRVRVTMESPDAKHQLGDVMAMKPEGAALTGLFNIELKRGYSRKGGRQLSVLDLLDGNYEKALLSEFWRQSAKDAGLTLREPLLIFKRDRRAPVLVKAVTGLSYAWHKIEELSGVISHDCIIVWCGEYLLRMYRLDDFLRWLSPEVVKQVYKELSA